MYSEVGYADAENPIRIRPEPNSGSRPCNRTLIRNNNALKRVLIKLKVVVLIVIPIFYEEVKNVVKFTSDMKLTMTLTMTMTLSVKGISIFN